MTYDLLRQGKGDADCDCDDCPDHESIEDCIEEECDCCVDDNDHLIS